MTCLNGEIKRELKLRNFKKIFQITKIVEFEIHSKKKGNWNSTICEIPHCSILEVSIGPRRPRWPRQVRPVRRLIGWADQMILIDRASPTTQMGGPNYQNETGTLENPNRLGRPNNQDRSGRPDDPNGLGAWWTRWSWQPIRTRLSKFWNSSKFGWVDLDQNLV